MLKSIHTLLILPLLLLLGLNEVIPADGIGVFDLQIFRQELASGFSHILPDGLDHIAFILGLFFLSRTLPILLIQTTLFTLAHSLMLGVVILTGLKVPSHWVEIGVGLSIAILALEGLYPTRLERWRPLMILLFGGIHGLAFAHSLIQQTSIRTSPIAALFGFNLGVELGQLVLIFGLVAIFSPWWQRTWYHTRICLPALTLIALSGLLWAWDRW
ncbi:HupE/UreJ protein [Prosthecobacter fusiformis]|uniref:HupE/UreJ protein n=1 Tax=Prosthecobacter fusiformis TaxID=48464 RepID=A0A4R7SPG1_9BACT|nr:HupE/UreJ family protein [Prosthecobacter fusiformis]TDU80881.1 HupE/UreJ protein [Prosthecobacter fusiformis]